MPEPVLGCRGESDGEGSHDNLYQMETTHTMTYPGELGGNEGLETGIIGGCGREISVEGGPSVPTAGADSARRARSGAHA